jgi:hypothetical protein
MDGRSAVGTGSDRRHAGQAALAFRQATFYEQLEALPEGLTGEILNPVAHILEAYVLDDGAWREIGCFAGAAAVSVAPFEVVTIKLDDLRAPIE